MSTTSLTEEPRDWTLRAQCRNDDPSAYDVETSQRSESVRARQLCGGCPVMSECAQDALDRPAPWTIRGSVAIYAHGKGETALSILRYVANNGRLPVGLTTLWCEECHRQMRFDVFTLEQCPGTVIAKSETLCRPCYLKRNR